MHLRFDPQHAARCMPKPKRILLVLPLLCILSLNFVFPVVAAEGPGKSKAPVHLKSDHLQYFKEKDIYIAEGAVVVEQEGAQLEADTMRLDGKTGQLSAMGNIHYAESGNTMDAERIVFDINTKLGVLH
ncbi:MAG: LptA/OstA family protein, partial [Nitrospirota bacterium]|nr:LptA/OstA family protein [Nitrospirota bacterium]